MLIIGTAEKVVGQQAVVGCAVSIKEVNIGLYVAHSERLVCAIQMVQAVKSIAHDSIMITPRTSGQNM